MEQVLKSWKYFVPASVAAATEDAIAQLHAGTMDCTEADLVTSVAALRAVAGCEETADDCQAQLDFYRAYLRGEVPKYWTYCPACYDHTTAYDLKKYGVCRKHR